MNESWDRSNLGSEWARVWGIVGESLDFIYLSGYQEQEDRNVSGFAFNPSEKRLSLFELGILDTLKVTNNGCVMSSCVSYRPYR